SPLDPPATQHDVAVVTYDRLPRRDRALRRIEDDLELILAGDLQRRRLGGMVVANLRLATHRHRLVRAATEEIRLPRDQPAALEHFLFADGNAIVLGVDVHDVNRMPQ